MSWSCIVSQIGIRCHQQTNRHSVLLPHLVHRISWVSQPKQYMSYTMTKSEHRFSFVSHATVAPWDVSIENSSQNGGIPVAMLREIILLNPVWSYDSRHMRICCRNRSRLILSGTLWSCHFLSFFFTLAAPDHDARYLSASMALPLFPETVVENCQKPELK